MKRYCFTVDDNIRFLKELTQKNYKSIFDHPYPALLSRLHKVFDLKVQLNLFYEMPDFDLSMMTAKYRDEWKENASWLKLSFHSKQENVKPYEHSGFLEVDKDCSDVHREILRFAGQGSLAKTTTIHFCLATEEGLLALQKNGVTGLLGLFGTLQNPRTSYGLCDRDAERIRLDQVVFKDGISFLGIDSVLNLYEPQEIGTILNELISLEREQINVMIHEQYFYPDYRAYQPNFEEKLTTAFSILMKNGYQSCFLEECL